jgi:BirA family biotin operon repressor/biotin-[acetyl-CoA-carboxylase] ligase
MPELGSILFCYHSLPSTNEVARELAASGASEGVGVLAFEQTAGHGRQGRSWLSPGGEGLYLSIVLRPRIKARESPVITLASAVAVAETLIADFGVAADIKWPNDVMAGGRKICGILVESATEGDQLQYAVLGIGVNVSQRDFPPDLSQPATSLFLELGYEIALGDVLKPLLARADGWYRAATTDPKLAIRRWEELSSYARGCQVRITSPEGSVEGTTCGLTSNGALMVELDDGQIREIVSGEVSLQAV